MDIKGPGFNPSIQLDNQYLDLATNVNGYITQSITLPAATSYIAAFDQQASTDNFQSFRAEVFWKGVKIGVAQPNKTGKTRNYFLFDSDKGPG